MASSINAITTGTGGVVTTGDNTGILNLQSGGTTVATVSSTGLAATGITNSALTSGRVPFASTGGLLADSANLTWNGSQLGVTGNINVSTSGGASYASFSNGTSAGYVGVEGTSSNFFGATSGATVLVANTGYPLQFARSGVPFATFDSSGNLGLGVTPSAWNSGWKAFQNTGGAVYSNSGNIRIGYNAYLDSTLTFKYIATGFATDYQQGAGNGSHIWYNAPSGTAGNTITFTQAMTLNASGNLALQGATTTATGVGITFPATQSASSNANCLDDYEEGTWTPAFTSTGATFTYNTQVGYYTKIGNSVTVTAYVYVSTKTGTLTNALTITGLPFASKNGASASGVFGVEQFTVRPTLFSDNVSGSLLYVYQAGTVTNMTPNSMTTSGFYLFTITYFTA